MSDDPLWLAQVLIAALADIAFACTLGGAFLSAWLSKENAGAPVSPARLGWVRARRLSTGGAVVLAVALLAGFLFVGGAAAIYLSNPPGPADPSDTAVASGSPTLPPFVQPTATPSA